jgi:predicted ABC-type transport system involved in lysophospholipase L1 biosynthesis ATPase subunit
VASLPDDQAALVSPDLPLRANLSARENIALIPLYQKHFSAAEASHQAQALLEQLGFAAIGDKRDPDMNPSERFVAKLARALILRRPQLVIERPGAMLYDIHYPAFLGELASRFDGTPAKWEVFDFDWNRPLYS